MLDKIRDPIFLNEKMLLNTAAYLFDGYTLKREVGSEKEKAGKAEVSTGTTFLSKFLSPISASGEISAKSNSTSKSERLYTLGGLHMSVLSELKRKKQLKPLNLSENESMIRASSFLSAEVILKPVDFYEVIRLVSLVRPLLVKLFDELGDQILKNRESLSVLNEIELKKYDKLLKSLLKSLEDDYLKSGQLEVMMISPKNGKVIGILDVPVGETDPLEFKAQFNDVQLHVVGKLVRYIDADSNLSLLQRSSFSQIAVLLRNLVSFSEEDDAVPNYNKGIIALKEISEKFITLSIKGPCVRLLALSVSS